MYYGVVSEIKKKILAETIQLQAKGGSIDPRVWKPNKKSGDCLNIPPFSTD
jgi:hypothetical protein